MMEENTTVVSHDLDDSLALSIKDGTFCWDFSTIDPINIKKSKKKIEEKKKLIGNTNLQSEIVLNCINVSVPKGALIGVCGPVGGGKSSFLLACLGQLKMIEGKLARNGTCAYVSQQSWIENTSLKNNIIFREKFDSEKYTNVIYACALNDDINFLPGGDNIEVGERGVNLSGGQKQRVSLARALYSDRDIYLLDDPLSAVDPPIAAKIIDRYILNALRGKTIILVTRHISVLKKCDNILVMKDGEIIESGTFDDLVTNGNEFGVMVQSKSLVLPHQISNESAVNNESTFVENDLSNNSKLPTTKLTQEEEEIRGAVKPYAYKAYINAAGGYCIWIFVVFIIFLNVGSNVFSSWWLAVWIKAGSGNTVTLDRNTNETVISKNINDNPDLPFYMKVYSSIIGIIIITCIIRGYIYTKVAIKASQSLHQKLYEKIFASPMKYFEQTPIGQIQNLFSRDIDEIDSRLPESVETMLQNIWSVIFSFLSITLVFYWFIIPLVFLASLYYFISKIFRVAIRDLKRMENISRAPLFSTISATVQGLPIIHAFNKENYFLTQFYKLFNENSVLLYLSSNSMRWMAVRLDFISVTISFITSFLVALLKGEVAPAYAGLALAYAAQICGVFQYTIRLMSENEARFISVERIQRNIEKLKPEECSESIIKVTPEWPKLGSLKFEHVFLSYGKDLPNVLNDISFSIRGGEKIGIVGRTGAGKSSLATALFRLVEITSGSIYIDGVNISRIPLSILRSRLSIIPQDPSLFSETLRLNLDPFGKYNEETIWDVLKKTKLYNKVKSMPDELSTHVGDGESLSVGEKQLVCLARTLLQKSKILILDEATASIDLETESAIQSTIQEEFRHCTVITIAHRLTTVINCDKILVLDKGSILEFDEPKVLMENQNSHFYKMMSALRN